MARVTSQHAGDVYQRTTGHAWQTDVWVAWMLIVGVAVAQRAARRADAQLRARVGARARKPLEPVPEWLARGIVVFHAHLQSHPNMIGISPMLSVLAYIPPATLMSWVDPDARCVADLSAHTDAGTIRRAAQSLDAKPREDVILRTFYEGLRVTFAADGRGAPRPREVALLAGALGVEPFDGLDAHRKRWEDRIRRWRKRPPVIQVPVIPGAFRALAPRV